MRAYAVTFCSREVLATPEGERLVHEMLLDEARTLGQVVPLSERFTIDPFERHGDLDSPMSTETTAVVKLACDVLG